MNKDLIIYCFIYIIVYLFINKIKKKIEKFSIKKKTFELEVIIKVTFNTYLKKFLKKEKIENLYRNNKDKIPRCQILKNASIDALSETIKIHGSFFSDFKKKDNGVLSIIDVFSNKLNERIDKYITDNNDSKCERKNDKSFLFGSSNVSNSLSIILLSTIL
jgi:hypothetical protein